MRRPALFLTTTIFLLSGCAGTYERVAGGAAAGAVAGAAVGFLCCHHPQDAGEGAVAGIAIGALVGLIIDIVDPI